MRAGDIAEVMSGDELGLQYRITSIKPAFRAGRDIVGGIVTKEVPYSRRVGDMASFYDITIKVVKYKDGKPPVIRKIFAEKGWGP